MQRDQLLFITLVGGRGGWSEEFGGNHLGFRRIEGDHLQLRTQKGESLKILEGFRLRTTQICLGTDH